jgi:hypothetical protein
MTIGVSIPVLCQFKFYPSDREIDNGVNFQNVDNTELPEQDWEGVYPNKFTQPISRYWNDFSPGIDFQIVTDGAQTYGDTTVTFEDLEGNDLFTLEKENFFTRGTDIIARFYADKFEAIEDGCYRLAIRIQDNVEYYSEEFNLADTHDDCYPLEFSNFENDFGLVFDNGAGDTWVGKMLIPLRMFRPATEEEIEKYNNDVGELTTLRSILKRVYEVESEPVATWFAEKIKMMFGCSDLILNKVAVNSGEGINIEPLNETDKMEIVGNVQLNDFTDDYIQDDALDTVTELLTSWTEDGATVGDWDPFQSSGKDIVLADYSDGGIASAFTNNFNVTQDALYLFKMVVIGNLDNTEIEYDGQTYGISEGDNTYLFTATATGIDKLILTTGNCSFEATCSFKKIT